MAGDYLFWCQGTIHNWYRCIGSFQNTYALSAYFFTQPYCSDVRHQKWYRCPKILSGCYARKLLAANSLRYATMIDMPVPRVYINIHHHMHMMIYTTASLDK